MNEIEAKVWLDKQNISSKNILTKLKNDFEFLDKQKKHDWYFFQKNDKNKKLIFRLRKSNNHLSICYKTHSMTNGCEHNKEIEFNVENLKAVLNFFDSIGYKIGFEKQKETQAFKYKDYIIEYNYIKNLGYFLEIEKMIENKQKINIKKERNELEAVFKLFGFLQKNFEKKKYVELLKN